MPEQSFHFFPFRHLILHLRHFKRDVKPTGIRKAHFRKAEWEDFSVQSHITKTYLTYRIVFMIIFLFLCFFDMSCSGSSKYRLNYYFMYFTHWTLFCGTFYAFAFGLYAICVKIFEKKNVALERNILEENDLTRANSRISPALEEERADQSFQRLPFLPKSLNGLEILIWVLQSLTFTCSYVVTLGYWFLIHDPNSKFSQSCKLPAQVFVHGINAVVITIDLMICAVPVHVTHFVYVGIYGSIYILFSALYHILNAHYPDNEHGEKPYIYSFLNWEKYPASTGPIVILGGSIFLVFMQLFALLLYSMRLLCVYCCKKTVYNEHLYDYN